MTEDIRNIALGIGVMVVLLVASCALRAQDCEYGAFGCFHHENHDAYKEWKTGQGGSCCNGKDCRPVRAKQDVTGAWLIYIPELRDTSHDPWVLVPPAALQPPDKFKDGRSHACTADPANWARYFQYNPTLPVYCFSPGEVRG